MEAEGQLSRDVRQPGQGVLVFLLSADDSSAEQAHVLQPERGGRISIEFFYQIS